MTQSNSNDLFSDMNLFPISMKISAKTIGMDLVSVQPMSGPSGYTKEEMDRIESEVRSINRNNKIESIIEGSEYKEMDIKDHPDYKGPGISLTYLDFKYGTQTQSKI